MSHRAVHREELSFAFGRCIMNFRIHFLAKLNSLLSPKTTASANTSFKRAAAKRMARTTCCARARGDVSLLRDPAAGSAASTAAIPAPACHRRRPADMAGVPRRVRCIPSARTLSRRRGHKKSYHNDRSREKDLQACLYLHAHAGKPGSRAARPLLRA